MLAAAAARQGSRTSGWIARNDPQLHRAGIPVLSGAVRAALKPARASSSRHIFSPGLRPRSPLHARSRGPCDPRSGSRGSLAALVRLPLFKTKDQITHSLAGPCDAPARVAHSRRSFACLCSRRRIRLHSLAGPLRSPLRLAWLTRGALFACLCSRRRIRTTTSPLLA